MGWGQVGGGAVQIPSVGAGPSSLGEGHCLSLPTLMFPPVSVPFTFSLPCFFIYLFILPARRHGRSAWDPRSSLQHGILVVVCGF